MDLFYAHLSGNREWIILLGTVTGLALDVRRMRRADCRNYAVNYWHIVLGAPVCQIVFCLKKAFQDWKCQGKK